MMASMMAVPAFQRPIGIHASYHNYIRWQEVEMNNITYERFGSQGRHNPDTRTSHGDRRGETHHVVGRQSPTDCEKTSPRMGRPHPPCDTRDNPRGREDIISHKFDVSSFVKTVPLRSLNPPLFTILLQKTVKKIIISTKKIRFIRFVNYFLPYNLRYYFKSPTFGELIRTLRKLSWLDFISLYNLSF